MYIRYAVSHHSIPTSYLVHQLHFTRNEQLPPPSRTSTTHASYQDQRHLPEPTCWIRLRLAGVCCGLELVRVLAADEPLLCRARLLFQLLHQRRRMTPHQRALHSRETDTAHGQSEEVRGALMYRTDAALLSSHAGGAAATRSGEHRPERRTCARGTAIR